LRGGVDVDSVACMTVLVTCGHTRAGLATVRALGRANVAVAVGAPMRPALALWSRYATSTLLLPDAEHEARQFADAVADEVGGRGAVCALAASDAALWALSRWRAALPESARKALPPHDAIVKALDRQALHDRARALGLPCVETYRIGRPDDVEPTLLRLQRAVGDGRFVALVRPLVPSVEREDGSRRVVGAVPVDGIGALRRLLYAREELAAGGCLIEPRPRGRYLGYGAVVDEGRVVAEVFQERLRERGDLSGVSTLARTIDVDEDVRAVGRALLGDLKFQGPCLVELFRGDDGKAKVLNLIPRLWGSLGLAIQAGVNVPLLTLRLAEGKDLAGVYGEGGVVSQPGCVWRWVVGDMEVLAQRAARLGSRVEGRSIVKARTEGLKELLDVRDLLRAKPDVFDKDDPMPAALEISQRVDEARAHAFRP
jgi:predicted ATP-grasp superfamily ATP-dependent carboligase